MIADQLQAPLAVIRLDAGKLRSVSSVERGASAALDDVVEELDRLHAVIDRLVFLARAESGALALVAQPTELAELVAGVAEDALALAEERDVHFAVERNERMSLPAEPALLRQLLLQLVANAVAASPPRGRVELASFGTAAGWQLTVSDEGPGLPAARLPNLFERFFQVPRDSDVIESGAGGGLGLAIARSIADLHGGTIRAENRADRSGLRVTVTLPRQTRRSGGSAHHNPNHERNP